MQGVRFFKCTSPQPSRILTHNRCEVLCEHCRRVFWYRCWWYVAVEKEDTVWHAFAYVFDLGLPRNLLSTVRPSRRCSVTFSIFWPSNDSLNGKSESWYFCRVVIIIDFVFTGLMSMWLTLHQTEIRLRRSCSVFWICTTFFLLYEVLCHPRAYDMLQNLLEYAEVDH